MVRLLCASFLSGRVFWDAAVVGTEVAAVASQLALSGLLAAVEDRAPDEECQRRRDDQRHADPDEKDPEVVDLDFAA